MKFTQTLLSGLIVVSLSAVSHLALAEEEEQAIDETVGQTVGIDVGFEIPTREEVQRTRDGRRAQAITDRVGRRVMAALELYDEDDVDGAIAELRDANPRSDYDRAVISRFLGNLLAANEESEEAKVELQKAIELNQLAFQDHATVMKLLADLSLQDEDYEKALELYQAWIQFSGELDPDVFVRMANSHLELQNFDRVIPFARKAARHYERPNRNPYVLQVAAFYEMQDIQGAINVLEQALELLPGERPWWGQLGMFYLLEEQTDKALATMEIAYLAGYLRRENDYRALVQMYSNNELPYRAAATMDRHTENGNVEATPRNLSISASSYHTSREFDKAAELYDRAIAASDDEHEQGNFYRRQGESLLLAERYGDAAASFANAVRLMDKDSQQYPRVYMSQAEAHFYAGEYTEAHAAAMRATEFDDQRRNAESWAAYIQTTAERRGVEL